MDIKHFNILIGRGEPMSISRTIIRRAILFPIVCFGIPCIYGMMWCFDGHKEAIDEIRDILLFVWNGDYKCLI